MENKIKNFTDLLVWQRGHELVLAIYKMTKEFPQEEKYGLIDQLRRASVSFTSNIAEGFGRDKKNDKSHFYVMALGSLYEIQNQLLIVRDIGFIDSQKCGILMNESMEISKMCSSLIKKVRSFT